MIIEFIKQAAYFTKTSLRCKFFHSLGVLVPGVVHNSGGVTGGVVAWNMAKSVLGRLAHVVSDGL